MREILIGWKVDWVEEVGEGVEMWWRAVGVVRLGENKRLMKVHDADAALEVESLRREVTGKRPSA